MSAIGATSRCCDAQAPLHRNATRGSAPCSPTAPPPPSRRGSPKAATAHYPTPCQGCAFVTSRPASGHRVDHATHRPRRRPSHPRLIPLLPFLLGSTSLALALGIVAIALFLGGEAVGRVTGRRPLLSGLRQLALGTLAVGIAYAIGRIAGSVV